MTAQEDTSPRFSWWMTAAKAKTYGCTHYARSVGIIPGFAGDTGEGLIWVPRSDLLIPLEELLMQLWAMMRQLRGEEPDFMFRIGREIA